MKRKKKQQHTVRKSQKAVERENTSAAKPETAPSKPKPFSGWLSRPVLKSPFVLSCISGLLLWAAFAPVGLWPLAWLAPWGWLACISIKKLSGWKPYAAIYAAAAIHWLMVLYFLTLPHPAGILGWLALSAYVSVYPVLFVGVSRVAVHQMKLPLAVAAPVVWAGLELARGYLFTGMPAILLGQSQTPWVTVIQIADLAGAYGVSLVVMAVSACLFMALPGQTSWRWKWAPLLAATMLLTATLGYGFWRTSQTLPEGPVAKVALIQGSNPTRFDGDPGEGKKRFDDYAALTMSARELHEDIDLIVWPESMFPGVDTLAANESPTPQPVKDASTLSKEQRERLESVERLSIYAKGCYASWEPERLLHSPDVQMLAGSQTWRLPEKGEPTPAGGLQVYNSALVINGEGRITSRYFKNHRVLFGEYVPLGDYFPWIYRFTPMGMGLTAGERASVFTAGGLKFTPSICFESLMPQVIRRQVLELQQRGEAPDAMVNVTNDGWFWGSAAHDHHLAGSVFRAVEHRMPVVVAANTGISASIDGNGRIVKRGPRMKESIILAEVRRDGRFSLYQQIGDLLPMLCAAFCMAAAGWGFWNRRKAQ